MRAQTPEEERAFNEALAKGLMTYVRAAAQDECVSPISVLICALGHLTLALKTTCKAGDANGEGERVMRSLVDLYLSPPAADGQVLPANIALRDAATSALRRMTLRHTKGSA